MGRPATAGKASCNIKGSTASPPKAMYSVYEDRRGWRCEEGDDDSNRGSCAIALSRLAVKFGIRVWTPNGRLEKRKSRAHARNDLNDPKLPSLDEAGEGLSRAI